MSTELAALMAGNSVHVDIINYLTAEGCITMKNSANWVDDKSELKAEVGQKIASIKDKPTLLANLKQAWREADGIVTRGLKRAGKEFQRKPWTSPSMSTYRSA